MAAHPIARPMTAEEFIRTYGQDEDDRHELIDGEVQERPLPGSPHDVVKNNLKELFDRSGVDRSLFRCWIEHTFRMSDSSVLTPDVAVARTERVLHHRGFTAGAPEIPIEVVVTDNSSSLQRRISSYLRNGAHEVWCIYPDLRKIVVYTAHEWRQLGDGENLEFPALLPGISIPVTAIFEGVEP